MDELLNELAADKGIPSIIMVAGVGGAGGNAVEHMWNMGINGVNFVVCNTDIQALNNSSVKRKVQLGDGSGAGNDPLRGKELAQKSLDDIRSCFEELGTRMLFLTAGMGGGTGTGASPVIAKLAHEMGILTVAIVTSPLRLEGPQRMEQAREGMEELRQWVDAILVINNETIGATYGDLSLEEAFNKANDVLALATKGIAEIITVKSNLVNVDFADVSRVMRNSGCAHMSVAAAAGENRATEVVDMSLRSPLMGSTSISGSKNILINISTSSSERLRYNEVTAIMARVQSYASTQDENGVITPANIIWGTSVKPELGDELEIVIVATGFPMADVGNILDEAVASQTTVVPVAAGGVATPAVIPQPVLQKGSERRIPIPRPAGPVTLQKSAHDYSNIEMLLKQPAYLRRKVELIVKQPSSRKAVIKDGDESTRAVTPTPEKSLF